MGGSPSDLDSIASETGRNQTFFPAIAQVYGERQQALSDGPAAQMSR
jgi:hypothetical protein